MSAVNVAIVGATGAVGQEFLTVLAERNFPIKNLKLLASARSAGKTVDYRGQTYTIEELTHASLELAPLIHEGGLMHSSAFDPLQECAENIGLVDRIGQDAIQIALDAGQRIYFACRHHHDARAA